MVRRYTVKVVSPYREQDGDWVKHSDYEALEQDISSLDFNLQQKITGLEKENAELKGFVNYLFENAEKVCNEGLTLGKEFIMFKAISYKAISYKEVSQVESDWWDSVGEDQ